MASPVIHRVPPIPSLGSKLGCWGLSPSFQKGDRQPGENAEGYYRDREGGEKERDASPGERENLEKGFKDWSSAWQGAS